MEEYQARVIEEKAELDEKREGLRAFVDTNKFWTQIGEEEQDRLVRQAKVMAEYSGILGERIAAWKNKG